MCAVPFAEYIVFSCVLKSEAIWAQRRHRRIAVGIHKATVVATLPWPRLQAYKRNARIAWTALVGAYEQ